MILKIYLDQDLELDMKGSQDYISNDDIIPNYEMTDLAQYTFYYLFTWIFNSDTIEPLHKELKYQNDWSKS